MKSQFLLQLNSDDSIGVHLVTTEIAISGVQMYLKGIKFAEVEPEILIPEMKNNGWIVKINNFKPEKNFHKADHSIVYMERNNDYMLSNPIHICNIKYASIETPTLVNEQIFKSICVHIQNNIVVKSDITLE